MKPSEYKQMMNYLTRPKKDTIRLPVTKYDTQILDPIKTPPTKITKTTKTFALGAPSK